MLPLASVAVQITVFAPTVYGPALLFATVAEQLSVAVAVPIDAVDKHDPASVLIPNGDVGQVITGFWLSVTFTVCVQLDVLPLASVAVQITVLAPTWYGPPLLFATVWPRQLSVAVAVPIDAVDVHEPASVLIAAVLGHDITGF